MLEKLPQALNDNPSTNPLTNPQITNSTSVHAVSTSALKYRLILDQPSESVSWLPTESETLALSLP